MNTKKLNRELNFLLSTNMIPLVTEYFGKIPIVEVSFDLEESTKLTKLQQLSILQLGLRIK
jgi:hypothetical protein